MYMKWNSEGWNNTYGRDGHVLRRLDERLIYPTCEQMIDSSRSVQPLGQYKVCEKRNSNGLLQRKTSLCIWWNPVQWKKMIDMETLYSSITATRKDEERLSYCFRKHLGQLYLVTETNQKWKVSEWNINCDLVVNHSLTCNPVATSSVL